MTDARDACPCCNANLGQQAFYSDVGAGDEITCEGCGDVFYLTSVSNGSEDWYLFLREGELWVN